MGGKQPLINEAIAFLEKHQLNTLEDIKKNNPDYIDILKPGLILGEDSINEQELKIRAEVCRKTSDVIFAQCNTQIKYLQSKLKQTTDFQFYGQVCSIFAGTTLLATLQKHYDPIIWIACGLSLIGGLLPIIIERQNRTYDKNKTLNDVYSALIKFQLEAEQYIKELDFYIENNFNQAGIIEVINSCNNLCRQINEQQLLIIK